MTDISKAGTFALGDRAVKRLGYGAMQLAGRDDDALIDNWRRPSWS